MDQTRFRYFIRFAGSYRNKEQEVKEYFGKAEVIELTEWMNLLFLLLK